MKPDIPQFPVMIPVARFPDREFAEAFCDIARECGVAARVTTTKRFTAGFDATMGGADSLEGYSVQVNNRDVAVLRNHLEASLEIDPLDPLLTATRSELTAILEGILDGNLCEKIIAEKVLTTRPSSTSSCHTATAPPTDAHLSADARAASWLGMAGLGFTAIYLVIVLNAILLTATTHSGYYYAVLHGTGFSGATFSITEAIALNIRPFLIMLVPLATGSALIVSRRQLRNGSTRPTFPPFWRIIGYILFWLPLFVLGCLAGTLLLYSKQ